MKHNQRNLINAVLASTLFVTPLITSAAVIIDAPVNQTVSTNDPGADGTIIVLPSGIVAPAAGDGILVNFTNGPNTVTLEPSNRFEDAVFIAQDGNGVVITVPNSIVTVGAGSGVTVFPGIPSAGSAIVVGNSQNTINNAGTIQVGASLFADGPTILLQNNLPRAFVTTINNEVNGKILNNSTSLGPSSTILDNGAGDTIINNSGFITNNSFLPVIQINLPSFFDDLIAINNYAGGVIQNTASGHAIQIVDNGGAGDIINHAGGIIEAGTGKSTPNAINVSAGMGNIINHGLMIASTGNTILLNDVTINQIINTGEMINTGGGNVIGAAQGTVITNGVINRGNITAVSPVSLAIDFSGDVRATILQEGGTINGDVFLGFTDIPARALKVTGGVIDGNIHSSDFPNTNVLEFSGGVVTGIVNSKAKVADAILLAGDAFVNQFNANGSSFELRGGFFNKLQDANSIFISNSITLGNPATENLFASNGIIHNVEEVIIQGTGTVVTANAPITGVTDIFLINEGGTLVANNLIQFTNGANGLLNHGKVIVQGPQVAGNPVMDFSAGGIFNVWINNAGVTMLTPESVMTVMGGNTANVFQDEPGSALIVQMAGPMGGPVSNGQLVVNSVFAGPVVDLDPGSFIIPQFTGFIPDNQVLNVITVNDGQNFHGYISNGATIVQPSAVVFFTPRLVDLVTNNIIQGQVLQLVSHRNPFSSFAQGPTNGVADVLDFFAQGSGPTTNDFFTLITQLDQLPTSEAVNQAMQSLIPPFNYGLIEGSHIGMDSMFESVTDRVWDVAWNHSEYGRRHHGHHHPVVTTKGVNSGDFFNFTDSGVWLRPIGAYVSQNERDGVDGYRAKAVGGALGFDVGVNDCTTVGAAVSYTHVNVDDKAFAPKDERINSWMGTLYGSFDFAYGIFFDAMVAGAHNDYYTNRVIAVNNLLTAAQASFDGTQWGLQGDLGIAVPTNEPMFVAPFVRLKYIHLSIDDYTEEGAGDLNLDVSWHDAKEFLGGVGLRMATDFVAEGIVWVPELMVMFAYDFENDGEVTTANFIGGGPAFETNGVIPGRAIFDVGVAVNALVSNCSVITAKYNLELRENFAANSAYLQYYYHWS